MMNQTSTETTTGLDEISLTVEPVIFRGYTRSLRADLSFFNSGKESVFITDLPLEFRAKTGDTCFPDKLQIYRFIEPGCTQKVGTRIRFPQNTPPGTYSGILHIGDKQYEVEAEIYTRISLSVTPQTVQYQGIIPGNTYKAVVTVKNNGNVSYIIPQQHHSLMLDMDYLCKASSLTISGEKPIDFMGFLDGVVGKVQAKYAKPITVTIAQAGKEIKAGEELQLDISFVLPKDVEKNSSYRGNFRIAGEAVLEYDFFA